MSKSFKEKKSRDSDNEERRAKYNNARQGRKSEKVIHNALRSRDVQTLIKYSEDTN
jgi:hypothetical protein